MNKKVAFYIMTYKGYWVLKEFVKYFTPNTIEVVIIGQDKNIENDYYNEIKQLCIDCNIFFYDRDSEFQIQSKYIFAISWRWLIKTEKKIIVLHDSLLPKYRGFAPLVNMLINGEEEIGVTALFADDNYDCGDIIFNRSVKIKYPITIEEAINIITPLYSELVNLIAGNYFQGLEIKGSKQHDKDATYSLWRDESDYFINWDSSAEKIKKFIDAVGYPYKGACSRIDEKLVRIKNATVVEDLKIENRDVGKVIFFQDNCPVIVCKEGLLKLCVVVDDAGNEIQYKKFRIRFK